MRALRSGIVGLALALAASPLAAQGVAQAAAQRGWIGVSFQILTTGDQQGVHTEATITDVMTGSPAQKAGLRPGDHLISVNGAGYQTDFGRLAQTLEPGDRVDIVVERNGRRHRFDLRAASLPPDVVPPTPTLTWTVSTDSVVDLMFHAMDSLRHRLDNVVGSTRVTVSLPDLRDSISALARQIYAGRIFVQGGSVETDSASGLPVITFFRQDAGPGWIVFPDEHGSFDLYAAPHAANDAQLRAMQDMQNRGTPAQKVLREARQRAEQVGDFRPLTPYRLGQSWVAGAQMVELKPDLGAYFKVHSGLLVVDVPNGTPAALAGLQPGDVIVRVQGEPVRSIADLRTGLSEPGDTLRLQVIRKGHTVQAMLGR